MIFRHDCRRRSSGLLRDTKHQCPVSYQSIKNLRKKHPLLRHVIKLKQEKITLVRDCNILGNVKERDRSLCDCLSRSECCQNGLLSGRIPVV